MLPMIERLNSYRMVAISAKSGEARGFQQLALNLCYNGFRNVITSNSCSALRAGLPGGLRGPRPPPAGALCMHVIHLHHASLRGSSFDAYMTFVCGAVSANQER